MSYVIDKGVPLLLGTGKCGRPTIYPFGQMEVGDSFVASMFKRRTLVSCAKHRGIRVSIRRITGTDTVRVWRIA